MFKDTSFVITFQLTLIGIVLIGGLFLIWKAISRIEENVDMLLLAQPNIKCKFEKSCEGQSCPMDMMCADTLMQQLFQTDVDEDEDDEAERGVGVIVEESPSPPTPPPVPAPVQGFVVPVDDEDHNVSLTAEPEAQSETSESQSLLAGTTGAVMSRNRLRQMGIEKLKAICEERGLSTDGTKNQLIERILL